MLVVSWDSKSMMTATSTTVVSPTAVYTTTSPVTVNKNREYFSIQIYIDSVLGRAQMLGQKRMSNNNVPS
ncbi:hypothetical protein L195_g055210 [Trifolium pratense]|uniref:Uncharacterized protein n=1 Tax=Trifolium pratense TaxID=57577 RepID=A0A2K3KK22_TRIPR|nr:hypothetical protein L195_g055210 [Trifolium pratense]